MYCACSTELFLAAKFTLGMYSLIVNFVKSGPIGKDMKERYIFYVFPHIGVSSSGIVGKLKRPGIVRKTQLMP